MLKNKKHYYSLIDGTLKQIDKIIKDKDMYIRNINGCCYKLFMKNLVISEIDKLTDFIAADLLEDFLKEVGESEND